MSADMMIISKEDDSSFEGKNYNKAFRIDETSMGEPHTEFGKWFGERFCGVPGILEQLHGLRGHQYTELTKEDVLAIKEKFKNSKHKKYVTEKSLFKFLDSHVGQHISTENW